MSTHSAPMYPVRIRRHSTAVLYARPLWAGLSIVAMWLAVLFVGVFGGSIVSSSASGSNSSVPVVVVVAGVAMIATWIIARAAFVVTPEGEELRRLLEQEQLERESLAAEVAELRSRLPA